MRRAKQKWWSGEGEGIGELVTNVRDAVHDGCSKKGFGSAESRPKVEKREQGEISIAMIGLRDLHRDTAPSQPSSSPRTTFCSTFEQELLGKSTRVESMLVIEQKERIVPWSLSPLLR